MQLSTLIHLIGDVFLDYGTFDNDEYIYQLYDMAYSNEEEQENNKNAKKIKEVLFKYYINDWVEIIPFYNLYFLKGKDGKYDFVFKNLRDEAFITKYSSFHPYLKRSDVPSSFNEEYDFERWLYFGHKNNKTSLKDIKVESLWKEREEEKEEGRLARGEGGGGRGGRGGGIIREIGRGLRGGGGEVAGGGGGGGRG